MGSSHRIFNDAQRELLTAVLNRIISAEDQFPGAGDLGLVEFVENAVERNVRLRRLFLEGLAQIEMTSARREGKEFQELSDAEIDETLRQVQVEHPRFFEALLVQTYSGYYTNPKIFRLIGYTLPQVYESKPFDESLLEKQRQRAPFWRQV